MKIAAVLKFSTLDYPGKLSAVAFTQGCPNRCVYCHNPTFLDENKPGNVKLHDFLEFLKTRVGLLDAAVFSGGEPLLQPDLYEAIKAVKNLGFLVGIHTSGIIPDRLEKVCKIADWIGFDIKTTFKNYEKITKIPCSGFLANIGFNKMLESGVAFEVRTTVDSRYISNEDLFSIAKFLHEHKVEKWVLQECILRDSKKDLKLSLPDQDTLANISQFVNIEVRKE